MRIISASVLIVIDFSTAPYIIDINPLSCSALLKLCRTCLSVIDTGTSNLGTGYCEGDDNKYENSAFTCPNTPEQFRVINAIANNLEINKKNKRLTNKALLKDIEFKINNIKNGSKDNEKEILDIISNCIFYLRNNY